MFVPGFSNGIRQFVWAVLGDPSRWLVCAAVTGCEIVNEEGMGDYLCPVDSGTWVAVALVCRWLVMTVVLGALGDWKLCA